MHLYYCFHSDRQKFESAVESVTILKDQCGTIYILYSPSVIVLNTRLSAIVSTIQQWTHLDCCHNVLSYNTDDIERSNIWFCRGKGT